MNARFLLIYICVLHGLMAVNAGKAKPRACTMPHSMDGYREPVVWRCQGQLPLWSYDQRNNECIEFRYGGCGGNENSFYTRDDCESTCRG